VIGILWGARTGRRQSIGSFSWIVAFRLRWDGIFPPVGQRRPTLRDPRKKKSWRSNWKAWAASAIVFKILKYVRIVMETE